MTEISPDHAERLSVIHQRRRPKGLVPLAGDASTRTYFRAVYDDATTEVIMLQAHGGLNEEAAFLELQAFLAGLDLPVPQVFSHYPKQGLVILEDLGDALLESVIREADPTNAEVLYEQAVDLLLRMRSAVEVSGRRCSAFDLAFDEAKLMQEMDFFVTHFIRGFRKTNPSKAAEEELFRFFSFLCGILAAEPRIFTHRDYHSRNLLIRDGLPVMIDFQDARMGPAQYDLASLLRDSYVTLPEPLADSLIDRYRYGLPERSRDSSERFRYIFDLMSLQRNIKALGTFGYQVSVRGAERYRSSIPRTAGYVAWNMARHTELGRYEGIVAEFVHA